MLLVSVSNVSIVSLKASDNKQAYKTATYVQGFRDISIQNAISRPDAIPAVQSSWTIVSAAMNDATGSLFGRLVKRQLTLRSVHDTQRGMTSDGRNIRCRTHATLQAPSK